jgi:hypothetical protein
MRIGIAVLSAIASHLRLRRIGASPATQRLWSALILLLGPLAWIASALIERRRAHALPARATPPAPLIASARAG